MRVVTIDTSTADLVTGLTAESGLVVDIEHDTRAHNEKLMPKIDALLNSVGCAYADLDAVVVGCGPGPFTGLRVGMSTGQALADALGIDAYGVCSHDAVAWELQLAGVRGTVLVATDARRKEIYYSLCELSQDSVQRVAGPAVIKPEELQLDNIPDCVCIPDGLFDRLPQDYQVARVQAGPYPAGLLRAAGAVGGVDAVGGMEADGGDSVACRFTREPQPLVPLYLRRPDAKEPQAKPKSPAIPDIEL